MVKIVGGSVNAYSRLINQGRKGKKPDPKVAGQASNIAHPEDEEPKNLYQKVFPKEKTWPKLDKHLK